MRNLIAWIAARPAGREPPLGRCWAVAAGWTLWSMLAAAYAESPGLDAASRRRQAEFAAELQDIAAKCDELKLPAEAEFTRQWPLPLDEPGLVFFASRRTLQPPRAPADRLVQFWWSRLEAARNRYADWLLERAARIAAEDPQASCRLVWAAVREAPEHAAARRLLRLEACWDDPPRVRRLAGATPNLGVALDPRRTLRVESEHFVIFTTARPLGVELAGTLERLHAAWRQTFLTDLSPPAAWVERFEPSGASPAGAGPEPSVRRHQVVLFTDRDDYVRAMAAIESRADATEGIYLEKPEASYFYAAQPQDRGAWLHEATHQLFAERVGRPGEAVAVRHNIWAVEGAAMYMETMRLADDHARLGGPLSDRLQFARHRLLTEGFYEPFAEAVVAGRRDWQSAEVSRMRRLYTQSCGWTVFIMQDAALRDAFRELLQSIYQQRDTPQDFAQLSRLSAAEFDQRYQEFLVDVDDQDLAAYQDEANLCLARCRVTDQGLRRLQGGKQLRWLDVSYTQVTADGLKSLDQADGLQHLNLDSSRVDASAMPWIGRLRDLEHLDLSHCGVGDEDLKHLLALKKLKVLWLSGCPVTDRGLAVLEALPQLETVALDGTQTTEAARRRFER